MFDSKYGRNNMVKAIFFDIDGTLVSFQTHEISPGVRAALYALREKGIRIFVSTGRGKEDLYVLEGIPFDGYITLNGQYCYTDEEVIYENTLDRRDLMVLQEEIEKHPFPCGYTTPAGKRYNFRDERVDEINAMTHSEGYPAADVSTILEEKVYQCIAFVNDEEEKALLAKMPHSTSARWYHTFCDICPKGGSKSNGIDKFLAYYKISLEEAMAFGDGGNDAPMLQHVPLSVAMGNAVEEVKETASYVTDDVDHDGVVTALRHFGVL